MLVLPQFCHPCAAVVPAAAQQVWHNYGARHVPQLCHTCAAVVPQLCHLYSFVHTKHQFYSCTNPNLLIFFSQLSINLQYLFWRFYFYSNSFNSQWQESKESSISSQWRLRKCNPYFIRPRLRCNGQLLF